MSYTIFDHAQRGHEPAKKTPKKPPQPQKPKRGWAVELGLGLGPQFTKGKKP